MTFRILSSEGFEMNRRMIFYTVGQIILLEGILFILPLIVSLCYWEEKSMICFSVTLVSALVTGFLMTLVSKPGNKVIYAREGFIIVTFAWIALSAIGSVPFVISGEIPNVFDAFFETVSGFTTTGASVLTDVESMSHGMLFWRSFTHWLGGMGVLVLIMAIIPKNSGTDSGRAMHILRAEMAGPIIGKLVPKARDTAKILYYIYLGLTLLEFLFLVAGGMPVFDSLVHAVGTAGTGGFGIKADSLAGYSPYSQWVITIFMLLFGVNFNLFYFLLLRRFKTVFTNRELWVYFAVVAVSVGIITWNIMPIYHNFSDSFRHSSFQVAGIISSTGYATADFNQWPQLSKNIMFLLMFMGGCAGSTAGGLKVSRVMILFKIIQKDVRRLLHPRSVTAVKLEGKAVDNNTLYSVSTYFALYMALILGTFLLISFEPLSFETNLSAAVSCVNNIGPGFDRAGPMDGYAAYSNFSKLVLSIAMLLGRLEIYPILLAFYPHTWTKK